MFSKLTKVNGCTKSKQNKLLVTLSQIINHPKFLHKVPCQIGGDDETGEDPGSSGRDESLTENLPELVVQA